eukprot:177286_1
MPASTTMTENLDESIKTSDYLQVKSIGMKHGFGTNNTNRLRCYSILLGCPALDVYDEGRNTNTLAINKHAVDDYNNHYSRLIGRDVKRNGYSRWNKTETYSPCQKNYDLDQIHLLLNMVFSEYPEFNYIQSMDSIFALFYLISNGNLSIAKKLIVPYLNIFKSDLSLSPEHFGELSSIWDLLKRYDANYHRWLQQTLGMDNDVSFALEWYISWFCHTSITDFYVILRIYDFMISTQNAQIGIFMVVAVLLCNKKKIMQNVCNLTDFMIYTKNEISFDEDSVACLISKCEGIMQNEMKRERRQNAWKHNKNELHRTWKIIKRRSRSWGNLLPL